MSPIQLPDGRNTHLGSSPPGQRPGESKSQAIDRLATELNVVKMAKTHAERKLLELQDSIRIQEQLSEVSRQQCEGAWDAMAELRAQLAAQDIVIKRLKADAQAFPLSTPALMRSHHQLSTTIDALRECFTCPLCYDGLAKADAVSLGCGHTFCQRCIDAWAASPANQAHQRHPHHPACPNAPVVDPALVGCPECRTEGSARVRLYMLEEAIRLLARAERERKEVEEEESERRAKLEIVDDVKPTDYLAD
ncbi:hypothetical protein CROQUDRAFT_663057 [Cronartium quercuum f. sp. fusiforme G11]|uniref:RING-type domain-containing protein n=1 Tax=Cronartium quercuum f. sp. fusiforme G11 TaxID=708437 RepID=A0A9P6T907_9BASI|nr:hypothetical protein CROQUDRAFT_663057 [Cronartium quercuum f. sp. fusiforme G11]